MFSNDQRILPGKWVLPETVEIDKDSWDFNWRPNSTDKPYIHQFGTQWQKDGGPRYIVRGATEIKYHKHPKATALPNMDNWEIIQSDLDLDTFDFSWHPPSYEPYVQLFGSQLYSVEELSCIKYKGISDQVKYQTDLNVKIKNIDIVFLSNGEDCEERNYKLLCESANRKIKWVRGIVGRENAIRKCAEVSDTQWVLVFPAKIEVYKNFDFSWQPNRLVSPKHYIFYSDNPVNGLCYGHMAPVAYNCEIVKNTIDYGLDFTMSGAHDIVPISAGIARFNVTSLITWRTAFREVLKLKYSADHGDYESNERLQIWTTIANGENAEYSLLGAKDALKYYSDVSGDLAKLKLSFSWQWLEEYSKSLGYDFV
jgi:hypothetical protein